MGMIFKHLTDVLRANLNDLVSKAEDPKKQLELMLDDMHYFRAAQVQSIGLAISAESRVKQDLARAKAALELTNNRVTTYHGRGDEANTRVALGQQVVDEKLVQGLEAAFAKSEQSVEGLKQDLHRLDGQIAELESKKSVLIARTQIAQARLHGSSPISSHGAAPRASEVLARAEDQVSGLEADADAASQVAAFATPKTPEEELAEADRNAEVEARLARLNAGTQQPGQGVSQQ